MMRGNRRMFIVDETMAVEGGFNPSLVYEGDGYRYPAIGDYPGARPWVWGPTLEMAKNQCRLANADWGLTPDDQNEILASVMAAADPSIVRDGEEAMRIIEQTIENDNAAAERQRAEWDSK